MNRARPWRKQTNILLMLGCVLWFLPSLEAAAPPDLSKLPPPASGPADFIRDIQPLFTRHCDSCHGVEKQKAGLRLDLKSAALKGGDGGAVIVPGRSHESRLIHLVAGLDSENVMPAKGERLSAEQVGLLRSWIDHGAQWPDGVAKSARSSHWSLQPLRSLAVSVTNRIDQFIHARLLTNGLALAPPADRATLIRRLTFDLVGLPPAPAEIEQFAEDKSPDAYARLVERLLASPRYGERWGRHWLDAARYTESQGFEYDKLRDRAWHYRDYVIKSFNEDKPYNRFMREQIAGDAVESVTADSIIGASLLVCGPWDEAGNSQANATQKAITREEELEDLISVVGQTFLGLTINCARCHSHKFDPISHEEYYRIKSVFEGVKHGERSLATPAELKEREARTAKLKSEQSEAESAVARIETEAYQTAAVRHQPHLGTNAPAPQPMVCWKFDGATNAVMPGQLKGGASVTNGRLRLIQDGDFFQTSPLPSDLREKTLEAWVTLADLRQGGGAAISIENKDGSVFDAIVFGERQSRKWTAGSSGFQRTKDLDAPEENASPGELMHVAVVYRADHSVAVFRNGEPYGQPYTPGGPLQTYKAGQSHVLLGLRHQGGGKPYLRGEIKQASLFDRALSVAEVQASFRSGGFVVSREEMLASLTEVQRLHREAALAQLARTKGELKAIPPLPVSYVGTRVQPAPTRRLKRGDVKSPDEIVTPGALSVIVDLEPDFGLPADAPEAQRRVRFADWLSDRRNPLPARVMVNRVWHLHFGQGLVSTPNDFGVSGATPSHPELLDWLATQFIDHGWSVKALHRLIVNSAAYRQGSVPRPETFRRAAVLDADNQLLWRFPPRRLEAETLRDAMLMVSGEINLQAGGPSYRPFEVLKFPANAYLPVDKIGPEFNRRTVYRMNVNSGKEPLLDAFDCPDPSVKTPRRGVTTTPLQALALMNNSFVQRQADRLAARTLAAANENLPEAIRAAYRHALGRDATRDELKRGVAVAKARGLPHLCWALLNSTEFVYVQ